MITTFKYNNKSLAIINICRLPWSSSKGLRCCIIQYNLRDSEVKNNNTYQKGILHQIKQYIKNNNIGDIIIGGDFNQNILANEIKKFCNDIGVKNIYSTTNFINMNGLDNTNINGRHLIDLMAASLGIM